MTMRFLMQVRADRKTETGVLPSVKSKQEAIEWAKRVPFADGEVVELRQVFETSDFPPEILSGRKHGA